MQTIICQYGGHNPVLQHQRESFAPPSCSFTKLSKKFRGSYSMVLVSVGARSTKTVDETLSSLWTVNRVTKSAGKSQGNDSMIHRAQSRQVCKEASILNVSLNPGVAVLADPLGSCVICIPLSWCLTLSLVPCRRFKPSRDSKFRYLTEEVHRGSFEGIIYQWGTVQSKEYMTTN